VLREAKKRMKRRRKKIQAGRQEAATPV